MNYRHIYHTGNFADIVKHLTLFISAEYFIQKNKPFTYLDTHSGTGIYSLEDNNKTKEYENGFLKLENQNFNNFFKTLNNIPKNHYYGSPMWIYQILRDFDQMILNEKHIEDFKKLKDNFRDKRVKVLNQDGFTLANSILPTEIKRILILIDPPFERQNDFENTLKFMQITLKRMQQANIIFWYPIKNIKDTNQILKKFKFQQETLKIEFYINKPDNNLQLNGCGLFVINPVWILKKKLEKTLPILEKLMGNKNSSFLIQ